MEMILGAIADFAAIATAGVAVSAWGSIVCDRWKKRRTLENYLRDEAEGHPGAGKRTLAHLMARLKMTETEILHAAFNSKKITCPVAVDESSGRAKEILFEYAGQTNPATAGKRVRF